MKYVVLAVMAATVLMAGCDKNPAFVQKVVENNPDAMAVALYESMDRKDSKAALKIIDSEFFTTDNLMQWNQGFSKLTEVFETCGQLEKAEVDKKVVSTDKLTEVVTTKLTFKGDCQPKFDRLNFSSHNGKWVVDFNGNVVQRSHKHIGKY